MLNLLKKIVKEYSFYEEQLLQIRKLTNCTREETEAVARNLKKTPYSLEEIVEHVTWEGDLPKTLKLEILIEADPFTIEIDECSFQPQPGDIEI